MKDLRLHFLLVCVIAAPVCASEPKVVLSPKKLIQGQSSLLRVKNVEARDFKVTWGTQVIPTWPCGVDKCGVVAVPVDSPVGKTRLAVSWEESGTKEIFSDFSVKAGKFKENRLKVDPSLTSPSDEEKVRIAADKVEIEEAYKNPEAAPLWDGAFALPTKGGITSLFGNRRTYNGEVKSIHFGLDLRANEKTAIHAANSGKVILAKKLFFAGNMVLIDHGMGIYSSYAHLSAIDVSKGQVVKKGDKLGMAGATGRVTGPHLHWSSRVNGIAVDPGQFRTTFNRAFQEKPIAKTNR